MAVNFGLDFAIVYACVLALFGYLAFWYVPLLARIAYHAVKAWLHQRPHGRGPSAGHRFAPRQPDLGDSLWWGPDPS